MISCNKVILVGNLTQDPELRHTADGTAVCNLNVATNEGWGENKRTEFHKVVVWKKTAEFAGQYLKKGNTVFVEGGIRTKKWETDSGEKRYSTEINGFSLQSMKNESSGGNSGGDPSRNESSNSGGSQNKTVDISQIDDIPDDEIPF